MSIVERLTTGLEFLKTRSWGQVADRQKCSSSPDGYSYCARGAVIFGGFSEAVDDYCPQDSRFHPGKCRMTDYGECVNNERHELNRELVLVMEFFDQVAKDITGKYWSGVTWYNDDLYRTKDDVIALFEKAIAKAKADPE